MINVSQYQNWIKERIGSALGLSGTDLDKRVKFSPVYIDAYPSIAVLLSSMKKTDDLNASSTITYIFEVYFGYPLTLSKSELETIEATILEDINKIMYEFGKRVNRTTGIAGSTDIVHVENAVGGVFQADIVKRRFILTVSIEVRIS